MSAAQLFTDDFEDRIRVEMQIAKHDHEDMVRQVQKVLEVPREEASIVAWALLFNQLRVDAFPEKKQNQLTAMI